MINLENYIEYCKDEQSEFVHLWAHNNTYLNVDICFDDDEYYILNNHPLWVYFKNSYNDISDEWLPLIISEDNCYIPLNNYQLQITNIDFNDICNFCQTFYNFIKQLANGNIDFLYFTNSISLLSESIIIPMSSLHNLCEMAKLRKSISKLPRDLYIDDDQTYIRGGHGPRIKFQSPKGEKNKKLWPSITFSDKININTDLTELKVISKNKNIDLSIQELNHIKYFIRANIELLLQTANKIVNFNYFLAHFKMVNEKGHIINNPNKPLYVKYKDANFGFIIVKHQNGKYNFLKNNKLISNEWFDIVDKFVKFNDTYRAFIRNGNNTGFIYADGHIEKLN